jgi:metal-sulfur cluster biosynthetic enzyme
MTNTCDLKEAILKKLSTVIDPETGVDVVHMRLVEDLKVSEAGVVCYTFRPSSPLCPIAVPLSASIQQAVSEVPGVISQDVKVIDFVLSDELIAWLKQALDGPQKKEKE